MAITTAARAVCYGGSSSRATGRYWSDRLTDGQRGTTVRYRCQVAWPSTGRTTTSPTNSGSDPSTSPPATISPHNAMMPGLAATVRIDVETAVPIPTLRSSSMGNDTTLIASTSAANRNPTPMPIAIIAQPAPVVNTSLRNAATDGGGSGPSVNT